MSVWWCRVNTKSGSFSSHFSAQPPLSQNSNLDRFSCYFLCSSWKFLGLSELWLRCEQILTTSCEHTRTLPLFSRAGIAWTQSQITPSLPIPRPWIWLSWCNFCFYVFGFNHVLNTVKLSSFCKRVMSCDHYRYDQTLRGLFIWEAGRDVCVSRV